MNPRGFIALPAVESLDCTEVLLNLIYSGLWFYAYNEWCSQIGRQLPKEVPRSSSCLVVPRLATFTIKKTNAVTSSVANTASKLQTVLQPNF